MFEPQPQRVAIATLLRLPQRAAPPPSPEALLAARQSGHAAALQSLQPRIEALEAQLQQSTRQQAAELLAERELAARLFAELEALLVRELASLAHAAAEAVLAAEPAISQATLSTLIADAIRDLPRGTLHVPPDLLESARPLCPDGWSLSPRASLAAGMIDAEAGPALQRQSLNHRLSALLEGGA